MGFGRARADSWCEALSGCRVIAAPPRGQDEQRAAVELFSSVNPGLCLTLPSGKGQAAGQPKSKKQNSAKLRFGKASSWQQMLPPKHMSTCSARQHPPTGLMTPPFLRKGMEARSYLVRQKSLTWS